MSGQESDPQSQDDTAGRSGPSQPRESDKVTRDSADEPELGTEPGASEPQAPSLRSGDTVKEGSGDDEGFEAPTSSGADEPRAQSASDTETKTADEFNAASGDPLLSQGGPHPDLPPTPRDQADQGPDAVKPEKPQPKRGLVGAWQRFRDKNSAGAEALPVDQNALAETARENPWGIAARSVVLGLLLGISIVAWANFSFDARWVIDFLTKNRLIMDDRMSLISSMLLGGAAGALAVGLVIGWSLKQKQPLSSVEGWLWFLSPLTLLPTLPLLLRYEAWEGNHDNLLPALLFVGLVLELMVFKCLKSVPDVVCRSVQAAKRELPGLLKSHGPIIIVVTGALAYAVFMSFYTIRWHHKLGTGNYDLAINNNLMFGGLHGDFNQSRIVFPDDPQMYLANHVKIGAYFFLPIYALVPRPETLQVIQSTLLGMGAIPLFLFARRFISAWMAAVVALAWLCYYPMHGANFYEVKLVPIASFFVLTAAWAAEARRWVILGLSFVVGMLMREDMPIGFAVMGGFLLLTGHRPKAGLAMLAIASTWFVLLRFYIMEEVGQWWFPKMYKDLWAQGETGFRSVVKTLVSNPFFTLTHVLIETKLIYLMHLFVPLLFLPARRWYLWAAFLPGAMLTLLVTDYKPVTMFSFQYVMHWAPYLFLAVPLALVAYQREQVTGKLRARAALCGVAFSVAVLTYNYGAFTMRDRALKAGYHQITFDMSDQERERYAQLLDLISEIPPDASVAASEKIGPHLSSRRVFYSLRRDSYHADYIVVQKKGLRLDRTKQVITNALTSGEYGVKRRVGPFVLMKRGFSTADNDALIDEWRLKRAPRNNNVRPRRIQRRTGDDARNPENPSDEAQNLEE